MPAKFIINCHGFYFKHFLNMYNHLHTLQDKIFPKAENVSYNALLSMPLSRFLINTLPTPDFLNEGSL